MEEEELNSYDAKFLDHVANSDLYKKWSTPKNKKLASTNAFDFEQHQINFDSSNQDEVPNGINPFLNQFVDLNAEDPYNEIRADNQSGAEQLGLGVARATTKALTEVAKLPGVVGGIISAPFAEEGEGMDTAFNNWWIKGLEGFNDKINTDILPVYTAKAVREGNLWDNISSTSFWATDGADGIGFIAAMMAPGAIFQYAGLGSKMIQGLAKSSRLAGMVEKTEAGVNVLKGLGITGRNIDSGLAIAGNTIFEAGAEAKSVGDDLDRQKGTFINQYKLKYGVNDEEALAAFNEQRATAMRDTFVANVGILLGPNAIMHKAIWGKAAQKFEKTTDSALKRVGKSAGRIGGAFASEGLWEEGSQTTVENMFVNKAMKNQLGKDNDFNIGDFTKEYINTLSTTEGQKAIFLGGILGGPMMSYQGRKGDVRNRNNTNAVLAGIDSEITNFNNVFDTNIYKTNKDGSFIYEKDKEGNDTTKRQLDGSKVAEVAKSLNFTEQQSQIFDLAVEQGNTEVVETLKQQAIFNMILPAIHNGEMGIQALEQQLNENTKFQEILEKDKTSDEKEKSKTFVKDTLDTARYLQKQNEKFQDFSKDVIELKNDKATPEQKQDFLNKLNSSYLNVKHQIKQDEKLLKDLQSKRASILEESNLENNLQTEDEVLVNEEKNNPLLKDTNDKIRSVEKILDKSKKDIADIWKGTDKIEGSFNDYIESKNKLQEETSPEKEQEYQVILDKINNATTKDDLKGIKSDNPIIKEKLAAKQKILKELEDEQKAIQLANQSIAQQQHEDTTVSTADKTIPAVNTAAPLTHNTEGAENHDELKETEGKNQDNEEIHPLLGHAKLISTDRDSGEKLPFVQQQFIDYERNPINKVGNEVSVRINEDFGKSKELAKAIAILKSKDFTPENIQFLINYLPFNIHISDNVFAPMETQPKEDKEQEVFNDSSKILRTLIVNELVKGTDINDIKLTILGQFQGTLKIDENVPENSILELDAVQKKLIDINDNIFMVNSQNDKQFADGRVEAFPVNTDLGRVRGVGEIYLNIPQANGKPYSMKLNIRKVNKEEASVIADIFEYRMTHKVGKATLLVNLPKELQDKINSLEAIIKVLTSKGKQAKDLTIKDVVDFMIWDLSSNKKSQVKLSGTGVVGETVLKYGDTVITKLDSSSKDKFINWLTENKRHNIKFKAKKNESKQDKLDINDKVYLDYLLSSKTLNTNAVVNEPTFQGYANIYLENNISVKGNKTQGKEGSFSKPKNEPRKTTKTTKEEIATVQETVNPITNDYSAYNKATDGINFYSAIVDGEQYYASVISLRVFKDKGVNTDELKRAPKPEELYGELITDNNIINQVQEFIRTDDEMFANPNLILNNYENIRNSENNSVSLHEIPNTVESKQLEVVQKSNDTFSKLSTKKQGELLNLLKTKLKEKVSLLKDKQYLSIAKENNSQKLYEYLTKLAKDNDLDIKDIEKHCK